MAIIVQEEKKQGSVGPLIGWATVVVIVAVAVYYVFFVTPAAVPLPGAAGADANAPQPSDYSVSPDDVLNNQSFQALKPSPVPAPQPGGPAPVGKADPFLP